MPPRPCKTGPSFQAKAGIQANHSQKHLSYPLDESSRLIQINLNAVLSTLFDPRGRMAMSEKTTIAIIDEQSVFVEGLKSILEKDRGFQVIGSACSASDGLDLIRRAKPQLAAVSPALPDLSGIDLTREIRNDSPVTKVVVMTGQLVYDLVAESFRAGAMAFIVKDSPPNIILESLYAVLRGEYFMDNLTAGLIARHFRANHPNHGLDILTPREKQIRDDLEKGLPLVAIANELGLSVKSVMNARSCIRKKLSLFNHFLSNRPASRASSE